ncbi:MAG: M56 family metallopeptidase [Candidatus Onthomonas sp.]
MTSELTSLFLTVAELSLNAVPVILVLFALRFLLRRAPKVYSYALWAVAGFRLLCPVALPSDWSLFNLPIFQNNDPKEAIALTQRAVQAGTRAIRRTAGTGQAVVSGTTTSGISALPASSAAAEASAPSWSISQVVTLLWLAGILCILLWNGYQLLRLYRCTRTAVRTEDNVWESDQIPGPFILGLFRPRIYLPTGLEGSARACVLAHERYHLRRRDPWVKALAFCIRTLHWFNPAVWLAVWAMERDMELSCDEGALSRLEGDCRQDYSRTLLALGANRRDFGPALAFGTPAVKQRILHVLSLKKAGRATIVLALAVLLTAGLTCCTSASTEGWVQLSNSGGYTYKMPSGTRSFAVYYEEQIDGRTVNQEVSVYGDVGQVNGMFPSKGSFNIQIDTDGSYIWTDNNGVGTRRALSLETADLFTQADSTGGGCPAERVALTLDAPTELFTMTAEQDGALTAQVICYLYPSSQSEEETYDLLTGADYAKQLYAARVQYVGDNSAVGALRNVVVANNVYQDCTMELFTGGEPYGLALHFTAPEGWTGSEEELALAEQEALRNGILMLALIDNAEYYEQDLNGSDPFHMTVEDAEALLGIDDLKAYGQSETGIAELLEEMRLSLSSAGRYATQLYAARVASAADHAAVGDLWTAVWQGDQYQDGKMEILDSTRPYGIRTTLDRPTVGSVDLPTFEWEAVRNGVLLLALVEDLETYEQVLSATAHQPELRCPALTVESAEALLGIDDLKACGQSQEGVYLLLQRLIEIWNTDVEAEPSQTAERTRYYLDTDADTLYIPCLSLFEDGTFTFSYDALSSYYPYGTWTEADGLVRCETSDSQYHYTFQRIDENTLRFIQRQSSDVEAIQWGLSGAEISDGALFVAESSNADGA